MDDLTAFANDAPEDLDPVTHAAMIHAQFEAIHPYGDGNGRLGRVLINRTLRRRGATDRSTAPISMAIAHDPGGYLSGLRLFELGKLDPWVKWFAEKAEKAASTTHQIIDQTSALLARWEGAITDLRIDHSARILLPHLPAYPLLSAGDAAELLEFTRMTCDLIAAMRACGRPVVGALNGTVAGAGAVIATACDVRIAAESAKIAYLFTRVGLSGADMGIAWLLPRIIGLGRATELLMTGDFLDAREALRLGLYNRVVPDGEALAAGTEWAARLATGPSSALSVTKRALEREAHMTLSDALAEEARVQAACMEDPNFREGFRAFVEKRAAVFS